MWKKASKWFRKHQAAVAGIGIIFTVYQHFDTKEPVKPLTFSTFEEELKTRYESLQWLIVLSAII